MYAKTVNNLVGLDYGVRELFCLSAFLSSHHDARDSVCAE